MPSGSIVETRGGQRLEASPYLYLGFIAFVIAMLLVDLKFFDAGNEETRTKQAAVWVSVWVGLAVLFGVAVLVLQGPDVGAEYFAGYLLEYSLSVDNMFVFVVIFTYFQVPTEHQHEVLFYGILGAMIFRGVFIALGVTLIAQFEWIIYIFGAFLIYTAVKIARGAAEDVDPGQNPILNFFKKHFRTTTEYDGDNFFTVENGTRVATPLLVTLLCIETTDILFAVDSIPAIFGITKDPFIILTSNVFAILGLRSLYFVLIGAMERLHLLRYGLGVILGFVGVKMLLEAVHVEIPIWLSLGVIVVTLAVTTVWSLKTASPEQKKEEGDKQPEAGSSREPAGRDGAGPRESSDGSQASDRGDGSSGEEEVKTRS
jgi:tellurite resistance protein TerC